MDAQRVVEIIDVSVKGYLPEVILRKESSGFFYTL